MSVNYEPCNLLDRLQQQLNPLSYADKALTTDHDNDYSNAVTSRWWSSVDI